MAGCGLPEVHCGAIHVIFSCSRQGLVPWPLLLLLLLSSCGGLREIQLPDFQVKETYQLPDEEFILKYKDQDGDLVTITTDAELAEMCKRSLGVFLLSWVLTLSDFTLPVHGLQLLEEKSQVVRLEIFGKPKTRPTPPQQSLSQWADDAPGLQYTDSSTPIGQSSCLLLSWGWGGGGGGFDWPLDFIGLFSPCRQPTLSLPHQVLQGFYRPGHSRGLEGPYRVHLRPELCLRRAGVGEEPHS